MASNSSNSHQLPTDEHVKRVAELIKSGMSAAEAIKQAVREGTANWQWIGKGK